MLVPQALWAVLVERSIMVGSQVPRAVTAKVKEDMAVREEPIHRRPMVIEEFEKDFLCTY
jgi:hypothetical protein